MFPRLPGVQSPAGAVSGKTGINTKRKKVLQDRIFALDSIFFHKTKKMAAPKAKTTKAKGYKLPKTEDLFEAGVHYGHQVRRWSPQMEKYIFAVRSGIHVVDLEKTLTNLQKACEFLYETAAGGGQIIFVGTKRQAKEIIEIEAKRSGALFVNERWLGGTITNFRVIKENMKKLADFLRKREEGEFEKYTKKEQLLLDRQIEKLQASVGGIAALQGRPDALFVVDARREKTAVREASRYEISVVGLVDTNTNPSRINYVIPGNDDAMRSIALIVKAVADAVEAGYKEWSRKVEEGEASAAGLEAAKQAAADGAAEEVETASESESEPEAVKPKEKEKEEVK